MILKAKNVDYACPVSRDPWVGGPKWPHIGISEAILPIHYTTFMDLWRRLRAVYRCNFLWKSVFGRKFQVRFGPNFPLWKDFSGIKYWLQILVFEKVWLLREAALFEPSRIKIRGSVWPVSRSTKKYIYWRKIFVIFYPFVEKPSMDKFARNCRSNHLFQILRRSLEGFRVCAGSNFAILSWLSRSP